MLHLTKNTCSALLLALAANAAFAVTPETPNATPAVATPAPAAPSDTVQPQAAAAATASMLGEKELPKLVLGWDCAKCEQNDKVAPLIEKEYASEAKAAGYTISDKETAEVTITEYRQRNPAARVMLGFMAGKDVLAARVKFRGNQTVAKDYSANAMQGMNSLCASISKQVREQLVTSLKPL